MVMLWYMREACDDGVVNGRLCCSCGYYFFFFFKQKTAYEIVSRDWSSDVCSSDLAAAGQFVSDVVF